MFSGQNFFFLTYVFIFHSYLDNENDQKKMGSIHHDLISQVCIVVKSTQYVMPHQCCLHVFKWCFLEKKNMKANPYEIVWQWSQSVMQTEFHCKAHFTLFQWPAFQSVWVSGTLLRKESLDYPTAECPHQLAALPGLSLCRKKSFLSWLYVPSEGRDLSFTWGLVQVSGIRIQAELLGGDVPVAGVA